MKRIWRAWLTASEVIYGRGSRCLYPVGSIQGCRGEIVKEYASRYIDRNCRSVGISASGCSTTVIGYEGETVLAHVASTGDILDPIAIVGQWRAGVGYWSGTGVVEASVTWQRRDNIC